MSALECYYRPLQDYNYSEKNQTFTFAFNGTTSSELCYFHLAEIRAQINTSLAIPYENIRFAIPASWLYQTLSTTKTGTGFEATTTNIGLVVAIIIIGFIFIGLVVYLVKDIKCVKKVPIQSIFRV